MKNKTLELNFVLEKAFIRNKDGKIVDAKIDGQQAYSRSDYSGLQGLLKRFDTRMHTPKDWKTWTKLGGKITDCYLHDRKKMELSLDETVFLKNFLNDLAEKNSMAGKEKDKIPFTDFEVKTLMGVLEQLEDLDK